MNRSCLLGLSCLCLLLTAVPTSAQTVPAARVNLLLAEERGASTTRDLSIIRTATRSGNTQTARAALRALGRLERPDLIAGLMPSLSHRFPEARAAAAHAIGQAAQGWLAGRRAPGVTSPDTVLTTLANRLAIESDATVRAAIGETIGRLPYRSAEEIQRAATALLSLVKGETVTDRLGAAKAFESLIRLHGHVSPPGEQVIAGLRALAGLRSLPSDPWHIDAIPGTTREPLRDARVRRLAFDALIAAGAVDDLLIARGAADADRQVRGLAMRAAAINTGSADVLRRGLDDPAPTVRLEALRSIDRSRSNQGCAAALAATSDPDLQVALLGLDMLAFCGTWPEAVVRLEQTVDRVVEPAVERQWHRLAHAGVALAGAAPDRARTVIGRLTSSPIWQVRVYGARAATVLLDITRLRALARDPDDNVVATAIEGLSAVSGHADDAVYLTTLGRSGLRAILAASAALAGTPNAGAAVPGLKDTLERLAETGEALSIPIRSALAQTLTGLGEPPAEQMVTSVRDAPASLLNAANLQRLAGPRARLTVRRVGTLELALLTDEAPATVLRFVDLAEAGYYDGLTFHRVAPNLFVQAGSPGANDYAGYPGRMADELGPWPHVRGTMGLATRGRNNGNGQFFINLIDNPRFDHEYTVFAQILNGVDLLDQIREGDVIERVEIIP